MLEHEADQARRLAHPNIVKVFDFDRDGEVWFITMELLRGERLKTMLARRHPEPLSGSEARRIIRAAAQGLAHAHERGVVHGDIKPSNIFVPNSGDVRLMDFGQAAAAGGRGSGASPMPARTPPYCSPERLSGEGPSIRDDVFALGCVAYETLTGHHPFNRLAADEARARRMKLKRPAGVTGEEWRALSAALAFASESRPANAGEFARRFFGGDKGRASAEPRGPGTTGLLAAMALGGLLGYLLGILVPAHTWLPVRGGDEARLAPPSADPVSPQSDPAAESGAVPGGTEAEWVAPPTLATVEIQTGADRAAEAPETTAAEEAAPDDGAAGAAAAADPAPQVSPPVPAAVSPSGPGTIGLAVEEVRLSESDGVAVVDFLRSGGTEGNVAVSYRTIPVTADERSDYAGVSWTEVRFAPGQETARQFVPLVGDSLPERTENFVVEIGRPRNGAELGPVTRMRIVIVDDD
jgi:serine/threonine protein kinase